MSPDLSDLPGAGEQRDPVADFFARERAGVRELSAGTDRWESIVVEASRPRRRTAMPYLAGAAAVVLVAGLVWGVEHGPGTGRAVDAASRTTAGSTTVTETASPSVAQSSPSPATSSGPSTPVSKPPQPAPRSFGIVSMSNAGGKHLYALGSATCPHGPCTAVIASDDDGLTWTTRASFETLTTPGPRTTPDRANQLVGIRFASSTVGYVYGSKTLRTVDGGRSWTSVDVDRRTVLSLETDGRQVWMATARSCAHAGAKGPRGCVDLQPRTGSVESASTLPVQLTGMPAAGDSAWIAMDGSDAYYNVTTTNATGPDRAMRLSGTPALLPVPTGCSPTGVWVSATANTPGTLFGVCPSAATPADEYSLAVSSDRGATWTTRPAPGLGRPSGTGIWLTATDAKHLVAVRQGLPSSGASQDPTTVLTSSDGGASWTRPTPVAPESADWVGAAGGGLVYAVGGGLAYWQSDDAGATFRSVPLRR
ncbi:hypothetical protein BJ986_000020 [Phycicoccus badiiscoriae]|uniref:Exo-alpha-sialidase n=1 Tax=Pedococcus badiiscoriae TaxID=642776 RepID=A0A852W936_9MICO|nr:hypothetical protein [Pedococcus badiiscoriae]NYG05533.1 hypothetical protein [Pedococcus badiiscoriae]